MADTINWELLKFRYEVLGTSLEEISTSTGVSMTILKYTTQDWKMLPLAEEDSLDLTDIKSLEDVLEKLGNKTSIQTRAFSILKQKFLGPKYVELETVLLYKAIEMANAIDASEVLGARTLKTLSEILNSLLERNPLLTTDVQSEGGSESHKWEVTIVDANKSGSEEL